MSKISRFIKKAVTLAKNVVGDRVEVAAPEEWSKGLVGFKPAPVFDISQTDGDPLPELDTAATGDPETLVVDLIEIESELGVTVRIVDPDDWRHGRAKGVCQSRSVQDLTPLVEVKSRPNQADLAATIIHEYAHAILQLP
ncbi:hypothetical protein E6P09_16025 (plasmid) [Haloferax mediterranei ATCC 33500]|uniref:Uncharacterized protein n=1 Tax=Haloferax mediterranei (strain ATCC 33500 / DSM 1411 / JCM 8866 / NBRC 14739 / NCIMB 2177 / R-4) TaxID=523841 RepID=I3RB94_HALMT|nr:hypothetical protein [Haloferax mediterranei]AHZ24438.1 hypothetical protein BM92_16105 [Haloferax mediterranei ATCC 33500]ELZ97182.1 hypothetical protein C439_17708 [Haloferax mediterranei ATCC 33500]MDX5990079.1 hypothetical protein [Haloferax mediterranei ATCC 33500]QCQ76835.1 hypothetical protein E6P09_16025 [Haloferax mediterranei ATCC 33500]